MDAGIADQDLAWAHNQDWGGLGSGSRGSNRKHDLEGLQACVKSLDSVACSVDLSSVLVRNAFFLIASCSAPFATVIAICLLL